MMRHPETTLGLVVMGAIALVACGNPPAPVSTPLATPPPATSPVSRESQSASAELVPAQHAELGFVLSAPVKELAVKEGETVRAGQPLIVLDAPDLTFAESAAIAALKSAQAELLIQGSARKRWNGFKFVWVAGPPEQRQKAVAKVLQAQAGLEVAQAELAQATLVAPFDGTVVSIQVSPGELVQAGQVALIIADLNHLQAQTTDLSERAIAAVRIGQMAHVRLKALTSELTGKVSAIAPMAGKSSDGDTVYQVTIDLDQQPPALMWGMTGDVEIDTQH